MTFRRNSFKRCLRLTVAGVAERLGLKRGHVERAMQHFDMPRRRGGFPMYPQLRELAVGDSLILPITAGNKYVSCSAMAKKAGIRVSVHIIDDKAVRVTRKS